MKHSIDSLDSPGRYDQLESLIQGKVAIRRLYDETYRRYAEVLSRCPKDGIALELGSGGGFIKDIVPDIVTSDVIPYPNIDRLVDAVDMPFQDESLRAIFMLNVFHHIRDVNAFLHEATRCLIPGGRMLIVDQYPGWISSPILKWFHHERFQPTVEQWAFSSSGPLSDANGALAWIVFYRDRSKFEREFPRLDIAAIQPHTPLRYWLAGGLKRWSLLPGWGFGMATQLDRLLVRVSQRFGSFLDIELVKNGGGE